VDVVSAFFDEHFIAIYFFYGLSFFSMGLTLLVVSRRDSKLSLAQCVHWLGIFGLIHGTHEFAEMFELIGEFPPTPWLNLSLTLLLAISFLPLLTFGFALLPYAARSPGMPIRLTLLAAIAYGLLITLVYATYDPTFFEWLRAANTLARYVLCIPGAVLVGLGLWRQRGVLQELGMWRYARTLALAGPALTVYGVFGQLFPPSSIIFPSMYLNDVVFMSAFGFPVQVLRSAMALVAAVSVIAALRAFEEETRQRLAMAGETRRELQLAARELSLLYEASILVSSTYDLETLTHKAVRRIVPIIEPILSAAIFVPTSDRGRPEHISVYGYATQTVDSMRDLLATYCRHLQETQAHYTYWVDRDGRDVSRKVNDQLTTIHSQTPLAIRRVVLPLQSQDSVVGSLLLETALDGPFLSSLEAPAIVALARQLGIAIENADLVLELRQREALHIELLQRATSAQEAERKRIARELHDDTGQALTALAMGLRGVSKLVEKQPEQVGPQIAELQSISTGALEGLRHLISDLRPSHLDDLGLVAALRWYAEEVNHRSETEISFAVSGDPVRLSPETETTLFRIAQEGIGNIVKHANAKHGTLHLSFDEPCVCLNIADDGKGFDVARALEPGARRAWGLLGIQERAALAGGSLIIDSTPGKGSVIVVSVPIYQSNSEPKCCAEEKRAKEKEITNE
jgi:signal transduction histidine kinase